MAKKNEGVGFLPTGKQVLIKPEDSKQSTTKGGIIIPETVQQEQPLIGTIVAVSNFAESVGFNIGQKILYKRFRDHEMKLGGITYKVIEEVDENILGIFTD